MVSPILDPRPASGQLRHAVAALLVGLLCSPTAAGREDPRPPADAPAGVDVPAGRRGTRRTYRRSLRRWPPADATQTNAAPESRRDTDATTLAVGVPLPATRPSGVIRHRDQPYVREETCHPRQRFDLHLPEGCSGGGMPLVVWIPGDSWRDGSKADCPVAWLAGEGYAVASIGYRLSDTAVFPCQLDDCRAAIAAIVRDAGLWGIDPDRIAVVGSGAGGHLAALVGLTGPAAEAAADPSGAAEFRVAGVCAVAAPASLTTLGPDQDRPGSAASRLVGGPLPEFREAARQASPVVHVSADDPPVLLVHGSRDAAVPVRQAIDFDKALTAVGVDSTLVVLEGVGHKMPLDPGTPASGALLLFLDRVLGPGIRPDHPAKP